MWGQWLNAIQISICSSSPPFPCLPSPVHHNNTTSVPFLISPSPPSRLLSFIASLRGSHLLLSLSQCLLLPSSTKENTWGCDVCACLRMTMMLHFLQTGCLGTIAGVCVFVCVCVCAELSHCLFKSGVWQLAAMLDAFPLPLLQHTAVCCHTHTLWEHYLVHNDALYPTKQAHQECCFFFFFVVWQIFGLI